MEQTLSIRHRWATYRHEPFRLLFPLAGLLVWAGILHWLLLGMGVFGEYRSTFHAMTQIQGAMMAFACGFLLTFIPRRTKTGPVSSWLLGLALTAPCATAVLAWRGQWAGAQMCWMVLVAALIAFALTRFRKAGPPLQAQPAALIWLPITLASAVVACVAAGVGGARGDPLLHGLGRDLVLQGFTSGLVLGVGSLLLPLLTRGEAFPSGGSRRALMLHLLGGLLFFGSFALQLYSSPRWGAGIRAAVALAVLIFQARLYRAPTERGLHRRLAWMAAWCLPLGFALVAAFPTYRVASLHVIFIGCFGLMALAVSIHVAISHGGEILELTQSRKAFALLALLLLLTGVALVARALMDLQPAHFFRWLAVAAAAFLAATLVWAALLVGYRKRPTRGMPLALVNH